MAVAPMIMAPWSALGLAILTLLPMLGAQQSVAFEHVHVVPMDREVILEDQTVVVSSGKIATMGPAVDIQVPRGTMRVDGRGLYLMPGLADMHVHLTDRADLTLFVAHGVTTVRNMWGGPDTLELREKTRTGEILGPRIFTTGPLMDGENPTWRGSPTLTTTEAARRAVEEQKEAGYDAFKVYDGLSVEVYAAILSRAVELDFPVVGHVPAAVNLLDAVLMGHRSIEHLGRYSDELQMQLLSIHSFVWNCPTLVVYDLPFAALRDLDATRERPEMQLVPPRVRARWDPATDERFGGMTEMTEKGFEAHQQGMAKLYEIVRQLHVAGAPLLLGTDTPNPFVVPGYSAHQELDRLVKAGLTPFEALQTGTTVPASFLGVDTGTVAVDKTADLLLLRGNPLEDITAARNLAGVMVAGRWLPRTDLDVLLQSLVSSYVEPDDWFDQMPDLPGSPGPHYEVYWNTTQIGAERFSTSTDTDGSHRHAQSVLRDQMEEKKISAVRTQNDRGQQMNITVWSGGRQGSLQATHEGTSFRMQGRLPSGQSVDLGEEASDAYLGTGILPHALSFAPRLMTLSLGTQLELELRTPEFEEVFEVSTTRVVVTRTEDSLAESAGQHIAVRTFSLNLTTGQYATPGSLTLDEDGLPVTLELVFQQGRKIFRRLK